MADGRRTRWVAHDVYFLDEGLGEAMFDRFGGAGVALWHGFIAACKKNHIEGETSWSSTPEALTTLGLPGMALLDNDGVPFDLDDWLKLLSDHKVIRRTSRGRRVKVACTKWGRWQQAARRSRKAAAQAESRDDAGQHNRRSEQENTGTVSARKEHDTGALGAQMTDTDTDTDTEKEPMSDVPSDPDVSDDARRLTRKFAEGVKANGHGIPKANTKARVRWLTEMDLLLRKGARGETDHVPDIAEVEQVIAWCLSDSFEAANVQSVPKFRERYGALRLKALGAGAVPHQLDNVVKFTQGGRF